MPCPRQVPSEVTARPGPLWVLKLLVTRCLVMEGAQRKSPSRGPPGGCRLCGVAGPSLQGELIQQNGPPAGATGLSRGSALSLPRLLAAATGLGQAWGPSLRPSGPSTRAPGGEGEGPGWLGERGLTMNSGLRVAAPGTPPPPRCAADGQRPQTYRSASGAPVPREQ